MLGDTAWELFHRTTIEEAVAYLQTRASQGFNTVWANVLAEMDGLRTPNRYGTTPFEGLDPNRPNESYFKTIDLVVREASRLGLYVGLLPCWGDKLTAPWGPGPAIFRLDNLDAAFRYGQFLGRRYADQDNILWVLGGDRPAQLFGNPKDFPARDGLQAGFRPDTDWTPIWRALASGIREGGAHQLMTYHPQGGPASTSQFLHAEPWLDLNAIQSGHGGGHDSPVWEWISLDRQLRPIKPTFDAEPNYEDHPVNPWPKWDPASGYFDDYDVRKQIYRSIFAGACGVIYGHHSVWQFASELFEPTLTVRMPWREALRRPGAEQIRHLSMLLQTLKIHDLRPDQDVISSEAGSGPRHIRVLRSADRILIYVPDRSNVEINRGHIGWNSFEITQVDPTSGAVFRSENPPTGSTLRMDPLPAILCPDRVVVLDRAP